jgi:FtsP/CotA-like multicopper oxidase with cupredoxin domain
MGGARREIALPKPDQTLRIRAGRVELAAGHVITTTTYNGRFPGPLLRSAVGRPMVIDVYNDTDTPERMQWQGQEVGEAALVAARAMRRFEFTPLRCGLFFYHSDVTAAADLGAGLYSGQAGPLLVEQNNEPGRFDREAVLVLKEFEPYLRRTQHGCEVGYELFSINGRMLGHGEPVRVNTGDRVLFHVLNASATESRCLGLPGHVFEVIALDGNHVPNPTKVTTLQVGPAERVSAIVEMNHPGVWVLGDLADEDRERGMGTVVEYAGRTGEPKWSRPTSLSWDYSLFGLNCATQPGEALNVVFDRTNATRGGFNRWTLNGAEFSFGPVRPIARLRPGTRYRLRMHNASDAVCPIQLQHHQLELAVISGRPTAGIVKDVITIGAHQRVEVEFVARNVGRALLQSTRRLYRDFGLMALMECI